MGAALIKLKFHERCYAKRNPARGLARFAPDFKAIDLRYIMYFALSVYQRQNWAKVMYMIQYKFFAVLIIARYNSLEKPMSQSSPRKLFDIVFILG